MERIISINELLSLQQNYDIAIYEYLKNDLSIIEKDVHDNLKCNNGHSIYRILLHSDNNIKKYFIDIVLMSAILGSERTVGSAKEILLSIKHCNWLQQSILQKIDSIFQDNSIKKVDRYFVYRNASQLLYELRLTSELQAFLEKYCKGSLDLDIQEVYEDFME
ncbi:MAG: hypothetical protein AB8G15_03670 [Saprospiraceae bacterium]